MGEKDQVPDRVSIYEVSPRDGLQNERISLALGDKLRLIEALVASSDAVEIGTDQAMGIRDRRKLSFAGHVAVNVVLDDKYELAGDPDLVAIGVAEADASGETLEDLMIDAAVGAVDSIPRQRRKDLDLVQEAVRRAVRGAANEAWGKKPLVTVFVTR